VTAGEDQPQPVVLDTAFVVLFRFACGREHRGLLHLGGPRRRPSHAVDRPVARRRRQPRPRVARDAIAGPPFDGRREGVLGALLGQIPVARDPDQSGDDTSPLIPEGLGDGGLDGGPYISQIGLTSMVPMLAPGIFDATSIASSRSLQSTR